jgi:hypothetical protein
MSFKVSAPAVAFEVRIPLGKLETIAEPKKRIQEWFAKHPRPKSGSA